MAKTATHTIKLASRTSALALWQTNTVKDLLCTAHPGIEVGIVEAITVGDTDQSTPLHMLGATGIFTKTIDDAVLQGRAAAGVHSLKDYPTQLPEGLKVWAVLPRDGYHDAFVPGANYTESIEEPLYLLSGSPRRKAQWLSKYPNHTFGPLRGNMDTRLAKMQAAGGGIVSKPGLERLHMLPKNAITLDWMTPAPAQGVMVVIGRTDLPEIEALFSAIHCEETALCAKIERDFMRVLEGGCALPLGALAQVSNGTVTFKGRLDLIDGSNTIEIEDSAAIDIADTLGETAAQMILNDPHGSAMLAQIKSQSPKEILWCGALSDNARKLAWQHNLKLHAINVLEPVSLGEFTAPNKPYDLVISSSKALAALPSSPGKMNKAYVVGSKTAQRLAEHWPNCTTVVANSMTELIPQMAEDLPLYYVSSQETTGILEASSVADQMIHVPVYHTQPTNPKLSRQEWDGIVVLSPKGYQSICTNNSLNTGFWACIGPHTAAGLSPEHHHLSKTASSPSQEAIIELLKQHWND